jgi:hypothetical protein
MPDDAAGGFAPAGLPLSPDSTMTSISGPSSGCADCAEAAADAPKALDMLVRDGRCHM